MELLLILVILLQIVTLALVVLDVVPSRRTKKILVDTSALIDGRILELAKTGFIPGQLVVPSYVIDELQLLADGSDHLKRQRAREGMDTVQELQDNKKVNLDIVKWPGGESNEVDSKLVYDAKKRDCTLFTLDYNLQKVAEIESIDVLNVNELSSKLRPVVLPGEIVEIKIVQKGADRGQGVGYLEDGTMVVIDKTSRLIGKSCKVKITRNLQTSAGRMMFAEKT